MTDTRAKIRSVVDRTRPVKAPVPVVAAHFLGSTAVLVLGEESLLLVDKAGEPRSVSLHSGAILAAAPGADRIITGGDDGKVMATGADGTSAVIASDGRHRWIDHVAVGPQQAVAWSAGKQAYVRLESGEERALEVRSTVGGLAFAPKGMRLAVSHYNGASLWFPNAQSEPESLVRTGSHLDVLFSPDGRFLITCMQEPALHGWRLADRKDMRMSGYPERVRSLDFTADGKSLATSGAPQLILWPFQGKDGPMGKAPSVFAPGANMVEVVACHPKDDVVAVGYADGLVLLVRLEDGAELLAKKEGAAPVTALAWSPTGDALAFGAEDGEAGIVDLNVTVG